MSMMQALDKLEKQRLKDELDAKRYRALRLKVESKDVDLRVWKPEAFAVDEICDPKEMDDFCDAAMKERTP